MFLTQAGKEELQEQNVTVSPEVNGEGTVHLYGPLTAGIVGVTLQHQVALPFTDHSPTL